MALLVFGLSLCASTIISKILYGFPMNSALRMHFRLAENTCQFLTLKCHRRAKTWSILIKVTLINYSFHAWCNEGWNLIFPTIFFYLDLPIIYLTDVGLWSSWELSCQAFCTTLLPNTCAPLVIYLLFRAPPALYGLTFHRGRVNSGF